MKLSLNRSSSLKSRSVIQSIFKERNGFIQYPIRVSYIKQPLKLGVKIVFSVPKKRFKKAPDRNRIKRQLREAYRLNQFEFKSALDQLETGIAIYIGFVSDEFPAFSLLDEKIKLSLIRLVKELEKDENET